MEIVYSANKLVSFIPGFILVVVLIIAVSFEKSDIKLIIKYTKKNKQ